MSAGKDKNPFFSFMIGSPVFLAVVGFVLLFWGGIPHLDTGPVLLLGLLCWLLGLLVLVLRWRKITRTHAVATILVLILAIALIVPNF